VAKSDEQISKESDRKIFAASKQGLPDAAGARGGVADWNNASPEIILQLVCRVAAHGGAVRLGYTRDGGAYSIGLYVGKDSKTYYCNEKDGIDETLKDLASWFEK